MTANFMKASQLFAPILKENPSEASIVSHQLMLRCAMIRQIAAGIYAWLPLGLRVLQKIENIVRKNHNNAGAQEVLLPCIQPVEFWRESGRYQSEQGDLSEQMLIMKDRHEVEMVFAPTAEEVICFLFRNNVQSYKHLPLNLYQIHWKFRDEIRPRFGVMRGREFLMKDAYSFHLDEESARKEYVNMMRCYLNIFKDCGLKAVPVLAGTGSIGGDLSHEFHVLANTGESNIFYEKRLEEYLSSNEEISLESLNKYYAMEEEKHNPAACKIKEEDLLERRGIEVGHVFYLGDKYSKILGLKVQDKAGQLITPVMGTYGIGVSRLVGAIIEAHHDEKGIIWPESVAPFKVAVINLKPSNPELEYICNEIIAKLRALKIEILYEDTSDSVGQKFAKMDLLGIPYHIAIGPKALERLGRVEFKKRREQNFVETSMDAVLNVLINEHMG